MTSQLTTQQAAHRSTVLARHRPLRRLGVIVGAVALMLALGALVVPAVQADDIVVEDGLVAVSDDGQCSLIEAIQAANADTDVGGCDDAGSGPDTIILPADSTYVLTETYASNTGLPVIASTITISGNGAIIKRDPGSIDNFRILKVGGQPSGNLTLEDVTIAGGRPNSPEGGGGVLCYSGSSVILDSSTLWDNVALNTKSGGGAMIYGTLTMTNSTVYSNTANWNGGGLYLHTQATATITNCTFSGNSAGFRGGGVFNDGYIRIAHSTIVSNLAGTDPDLALWHGGGLFVGNDGEVTLSHTIVSGNEAEWWGNELYNDSGTVKANDYNLFGQDGEDDDAAFHGTFSPGGEDITATSDGTNPTALDAILDTTLADNGGDTWTHALVAGSPAVDTGNPSFTEPPLYDQRGSGYDRVVKNLIDIGAYEFGAGPEDTPQPVGGVTRPMASLAVLQPWLALGVLMAIAAGGGAALNYRWHRRS